MEEWALEHGLTADYSFRLQHLVSKCDLVGSRRKASKWKSLALQCSAEVYKLPGPTGLRGVYVIARSGHNDGKNVGAAQLHGHGHVTWYSCPFHTVSWEEQRHNEEKSSKATAVQWVSLPCLTGRGQATREKPQWCAGKLWNLMVWWVDLGWLPDIHHPAALSLPILNSTGGEKILPHTLPLMPWGRIPQATVVHELLQNQSPMNTVPSENIYLLHHGFFHRLQGNLCSGAWNTSPFCSDLCACRAVSHTFFPCSSLLWNILPFLKNVFKEVPPSSLMGPAASYMSCFGVSWLQPCPAWGTPGLLSQRSLLQSPADKILPHKSRDRRQYFFHWELDHDFESLKA